MICTQQAIPLESVLTSIYTMTLYYMYNQYLNCSFLAVNSEEVSAVIVNEGPGPVSFPSLENDHAGGSVKENEDTTETAPQVPSEQVVYEVEPVSDTFQEIMPNTEMPDDFLKDGGLYACSR